MPFKFTRLEIDAVLLVEPKLFGDERGFFLEFYKRSDFEQAGIPGTFVQDNHSRSTRGVLRGLHYQKSPRAQGKLIRCIEGAIYDVAVDIRKGSPSYGKWVGRTLTAENREMLYVPPGFAHGFLTLSDAAEILYKCTDEYSPAHDRGIIWNDPDIAVSWDISSPVLSDKDRGLPCLQDADNEFLFAP